jgi:5-methylcytosine-specific restriction enzyme subunit McrC
MSERRIITLTEWEKPKQIALSPQEAEALRQLEAAGRIDVTWHSPTEASVSGSAGYVGLADLSAETQILIQPHIPVGSVMELVCYAYGLEPPHETLLGDASLAGSGPPDWLAFLLVLEIQKLLAQGLRFGYRETEDTLPYVRGRIDFTTLRWSAIPSALIPCRFEDFVLDTVENRILRGTLEILASVELTPGIRKAVWRALSAFRQVCLVRPTRMQFARAHVSRLNSYYEPALTLCRLVLESAGIDLDSGDVATPGFFFSMANAFERAVERALREQFGKDQVHPQHPYSDRIRVVEGSPAVPVTFRPDNVIGPAEAPFLVVDAKYKNPLRDDWQREYLKNEDLYQAFTYATALGAGVTLVYPQVGRAVDTLLRLNGHAVRIVTVALERGDCTSAFARSIAAHGPAPSR